MQEPVDPKHYDRIFQRDMDGQAILDELSARFYDQQSYTKGDPHETSFKEGQRSVVALIIRKCGLAIDDNQTSEVKEDA